MSKTDVSDRPHRFWASAPAWLWPAVKAVIAVVVIAAVGWQFASILAKPDLWTRPFTLHPAWLAAASVLYLLGLGLPALFWRRLLRVLGQRPSLLASLRAYYVGQLGRYVPGKVVGLTMRARLLAGPSVRMSVAVVTVVYESLTTLASGVLIAVLWFTFDADGRGAQWTGRGLALLAVLGVLLLPAVFNRLVGWTARPFRQADAAPLPRVRGTTLTVGLAITGCGWLMQGGALWATATALVPGAWESPVDAWVRCAAYVGLAYAAGFLIFAAPGGLGVRDYLIAHFLAADLQRTLGPEEAAGAAVIAALVLRLLWTVMDVVAAGACYWLPVGRDGERPA